MKRITLLLTALLGLTFFSYPGGIVHNTNQSASWVRMFARDASTDIDAVFYNPAGLTKLGDGFFLSINNQTLSQNRTINNNYTYLNNTPRDFEGSVTAPVFPSVYASYNTGKFAFSFGVNVVGGGGSATFNKGLPSFEMGISDLVPALSSQGVTAYSLDAYLKGTSVFWGYQLGVSYEINDMFSVYLGGRYITAKNTYEGHLKDVNITVMGSDMAASDFFTASAATATSTATSLGNIVTAGYGSLTLAEAETYTIIDAATRASLEAGYTAIGLDPATATIADGQAGFTSSAQTATAKATLLADQEADVEQVGSGITPIIGVNISPNDKLNIALKYEFKTKLELENKTTDDLLTDFETDGTPITMFPDGEKFNNDMPAFLSLGVNYKLTDKLSIASGFHYWFDKNADYSKKIDKILVDNDKVIDKNYWEWALGVEYAISEKILISAGYNRTQTGVKEEYQSDLDHILSSNSIGLGGAYSITSNIDINLGIAYTKYVEGEKNFQHDFGGLGTTMIDVNEMYNKDNLFFGLGLDFKFGGKSE